MKAVNAYFRKHKTLEGCPSLTPEQITKLQQEMAQSWHLDKSRPYPAYMPVSYTHLAVSPFPPAATAQNTVTAVRPMLPGAMQPSASAASGQRRGVSRFRGFKSLAASGFPDTLLECAGYSYGNCEKRL